MIEKLLDEYVKLHEEEMMIYKKSDEILMKTKGKETKMKDPRTLSSENKNLRLKSNQEATRR
jgi:hypothetical protein